MCFLKYFKERKKQKLKAKERRIRELKSGINWLESQLPFVKKISYGDDDPRFIDYLNEIEKDKQELKRLKESL